MAETGEFSFVSVPHTPARRMASRVARARARAPARVFLAHPRAVFLFVVACATLVPRLARAEREGWLLTTLTRASSGASSEDANGELTYPKSVAFTLDAFGTTYDANVRANGELTSRDCAAEEAEAKGAKGADGERRRDRGDRPGGVSRVERIANDEYDVIPMNATGARGMSRCQYSGAAEANGTSPARVAAALCDGFVKGQIRAKNSTVYFEQASEEAAGAYLSTHLLPALDPLGVVVLNVSLGTQSHRGVVDRPRASVRTPSSFWTKMDMR